MLTSYDGTTISYDTIGNPANWRNGITDVTWNGRELNSFVKGSYTYSFKYNADGIRTEQTKWYTGSSMAEIYHYVLDGTKIVSEYKTYSTNPTPSNVKYYFYDAAGSIAGFEYNGTTYYFQKNLQGDIIRICNISGNTVVEYTYDAWGKVLSVTGSLASTVGQTNPFRYRGYYYDTETGLYYLQTRYYDPEIGRFLNADGYIGANGDIPGYNMFAYCSNNPIIHSDFKGTGFFSDLWSGLCEVVQVVWDAVETVVDTVTEVINNVIEDAMNFDPFNNDEQKVLNSHYFSCYKGVPAIVNLPIGQNAFSYGMMFLGDTDKLDAQTVRHEYGHAVHFSQIGIINYTLFVAVPSLYGYWTKVPYEEYYSQPWEYIADQLGGVQRTNYNYSADAQSNAARWWRLSKSPLLTLIQELLE